MSSSKKITSVKLQPSPKWRAAPLRQFKDANGAGLRYAPCCAKAVKTFCVCNQCTECPEHGRVCHGSHD